MTVPTDLDRRFREAAVALELVDVGYDVVDSPVGKLLVSVCTNVSCLVNGGPDLLSQLSHHYADDPDVTVEEVECIAACDLAPVLQVNYEFHGPLTGETAVELIEAYKRGDRVARTISGTAISSLKSAGSSGGTA